MLLFRVKTNKPKIVINTKTPAMVENLLCFMKISTI